MVVIVSFRSVVADTAEQRTGPRWRVKANQEAVVSSSSLSSYGVAARGPLRCSSRHAYEWFVLLLLRHGRSQVVCTQSNATLYGY